MFWDLFLLAVTVGYLINLYMSWHKNYWLRKGFPYLQPGMLFGNVKDVVLMKKTIGQVYQDIYRELGNKPLGGFYKLRRPILMIKHPDLIKTVLVDRFDRFQSNDIQVRRDVNPILKMNPLLASGATWRSMKSVWTPLLSDKAVNGPTALSKKAAKHMSIYLNSKTGRSVEGKELSRKFVGDVIAGWAIGIELDSFQNPSNTFRSMSDLLIKRDIKSNLALLIALYAPHLLNLFSFRIISKAATKYFISLISSVCQRRVKERHSKDDFIQHMIDVNTEFEQSGEGAVYNYETITGHSMNLFLNGLIMTSDPLCWCLYELGRNVDVQKKLRKEISASGLTAIEELDVHILAKLPYLDMVLFECYRLHPSIQSITRVCNEETVLELDGHKYTIDVGTPVNIPVYALHKDPAHFPEPDRFWPDRFGSDLSTSHSPIVYIPFSAGPRACPGEKFANVVLKVGIAALVMNYHIELNDSMKALDQDPMSTLVNAPKGDVLLQFKPVTASS